MTRTDFILGLLIKSAINNINRDNMYWTRGYKMINNFLDCRLKGKLDFRGHFT